MWSLFIWNGVVGNWFSNYNTTMLLYSNYIWYSDIIFIREFLLLNYIIFKTVEIILWVFSNFGWMTQEQVEWNNSSGSHNVITRSSILHISVHIERHTRVHTHTYKETYQLVPSRTPPSSGARVPYPKSERLEESISKTISSGGKKWQNGYCIYFSHPPQLSGPMMAQNVGAFRGKICFIFPFNFL